MDTTVVAGRVLMRNREVIRNYWRLVQTYRATGDPRILSDARKTINLFDKYFLDKKKDGYFSHIDPVNFEKPLPSTRTSTCQLCWREHSARVAGWPKSSARQAAVPPRRPSRPRRVSRSSSSPWKARSSTFRPPA